jgi:hypothetical protein
MAAHALPTPFQSLDDQPRLKFTEFERQVIDDAGSVCLDVFPHGLLLFVAQTAYGRHFNRLSETTNDSRPLGNISKQTEPASSMT